MEEFKTHGGVCQGIAREQCINLLTLGLIAFKKFEPRRNVVKEVFNPHNRANRHTNRFEGTNPPPGNRQTGANRNVLAA